MDVSFLESTANLAAKHCVGFDRFGKLLLNNRLDSISGSLISTDQISGSSTMSISTLILDAVAPPPVRPKTNRNSTKMLNRKKRRLRRRSIAGGGDGGNFGGGEDDGFFGDGGYFGGGFGDGGGGNGGWRFGGFGGNGWDESSEGSYSAASDPASDFVYEVICWIALSNCVHFAFKKVVRGVAGMIGEHGSGREKAQMRLGSVC